jgi:hypothetical protein
MSPDDVSLMKIGLTDTMSENVLMVMVPPSIGPSEGLLEADADGDVLAEELGEAVSDGLLLVQPAISTAAIAKTVKLETHLFFLTSSSSSCFMKLNGTSTM